MQNKIDFYTLRVSFWGILPDGVRPYIHRGFNPVEPGGYAPHEFNFKRAPSRKDFADLAEQLTWIQTEHGKKILASVAANPWPFILMGFKAARVDLLDENGNRVGCVEVCRESMADNAGYGSIEIPYSLQVSAAQHIQGDNRAEALAFLDRQRHAVAERAAENPGMTEKEILSFFRNALRAAGFKRSSDKAKASAAQ